MVLENNSEHRAATDLDREEITLSANVCCIQISIEDQAHT